MDLVIILVVTYIIVIFTVIFILISYFYSDIKGAPFVPIQKNVLTDALKEIQLNKDDVFCDLGSGNGIVLERVCFDYGVQNLCGAEISLWPYFISKLRFFYKLKIQKKTSCNIRLRRTDIRNYDIHEATVVYAYLFPALLNELSGKFYNFLLLNKNARVVTPVFEVAWKDGELENIHCKKIKSYNEKWHKEVFIYVYSAK